jgi:CheY-like chemotaxis protein
MAVGTILVVEENEIQREGIALVLRQYRYAVVTMEDTEEAMIYLRAYPPPDLILLDVLYPPGVRGGWAFLEVHKQEPSLQAIPVLITTAFGDANDEWAVSLGADGCLKKPFDTQPLLEAIRRLTERPRRDSGSD